MRKTILAAASATLLATSASAFAAEQTIDSVVIVNPTTGTLTLRNGETYHFANGAQLLGFLPGQTVGVAHNGTEGIGIYDPDPAN